MFNPEDLKNCHIISTPKKYQTTKDDLRQAYKTLTPLERLVYVSYHINTLREISHILRRSYSGVKLIYKRACIEIERSKKG